MGFWKLETVVSSQATGSVVCKRMKLHTSIKVRRDHGFKKWKEVSARSQMKLPSRNKPELTDHVEHKVIAVLRFGCSNPPPLPCLLKKDQEVKLSDFSCSSTSTISADPSL